MWRAESLKAGAGSRSKAAEPCPSHPHLSATVLRARGEWALLERDEKLLGGGVSLVSMGTLQHGLVTDVSHHAVRLLSPPQSSFPRCSCGAKHLLTDQDRTRPAWHMVHFPSLPVVLLTKRGSWRQHGPRPSCCVLCWCKLCDFWAFIRLLLTAAWLCCDAETFPCLHVDPGWLLPLFLLLLHSCLLIKWNVFILFHFLPSSLKPVIFLSNCFHFFACVPLREKGVWSFVEIVSCSQSTVRQDCMPPIQRCCFF